MPAEEMLPEEEEEEVEEESPAVRVFRNVQYMGSFPVSGFDAAQRAEYLRAKLDLLQPGSSTGCAPNYDRSTSVLLIVSLAGIKVCSPDGKRVQMAHALRRISYATCEPRIGQFSFLAREPRTHFSLQYCHSFITESPEQAEELNNIIGNAFRMAYVAQLQRQPTLQDVINPHSSSLSSESHYREGSQDVLDNNDSSDNNNSSFTENNNALVGGSDISRSPTPPASSAILREVWKSSASTGSGSQNTDDCSSISTYNTEDMNLHLGCGSDSPTLRLSSVKAPNSIPGLRSVHGFDHNILSPLEDVSTSKSISQQSTPSSEESNSPTELNSYKRMTDKPPLIKRLAMGISGGKDLLDDDNCPLVEESSESNTTSPIRTIARPSSAGGYVNECVELQQNSSSTPHRYCNGKLPSDGLNDTIDSTKNFNIENNRLTQNGVTIDGDYRTAATMTRLRSQWGTSISSDLASDSTHHFTERYEGFTKQEEIELKRASWFQAGIPREIALEVLRPEPEGTFMVRESTSKPGCFALSLRVSRDFQPSGFAHYLIMRTNKGYKIKGFTKEFTTLNALITHHSIMQELLPCTLTLNRKPIEKEIVLSRSSELADTFFKINLKSSKEL